MRVAVRVKGQFAEGILRARDCPPSLVWTALPRSLERSASPAKSSAARWCLCGGSSSATAARRRPAPPRWADSRAHRCRPARSGRSRAQRSSCSIIAAAVSARAHGDHVPRLGHLVVDLAQRRGHLVAQRAGYDHHVRLARTGARREAETLEVVARHGRLHHLHRAAGEAESHPHQRAGARPGDEVVGGGDQKALVGELGGDLLEEGVVQSWNRSPRRSNASRRPAGTVTPIPALLFSTRR